MNWRDKLKESNTTASEFLDSITDFLCDTKGRSNEELAEDLRAKGIDPDKAVKRVKKLLAEHGIKPKGE